MEAMAYIWEACRIFNKDSERWGDEERAWYRRYLNDLSE